jgi:hypothetical protein
MSRNSAENAPMKAGQVLPLFDQARKVMSHIVIIWPTSSSILLTLKSMSKNHYGGNMNISCDYCARILGILAFTALFMTGSSSGQGSYPYPATGQSQAQPGAIGAPPARPQRHVARGAARGAALGAVGGAISGNAGTGAAAGAAMGGLAGGMRRRDQRLRQNQQ